MQHRWGINIYFACKEHLIEGGEGRVIRSRSPENTWGGGVQVMNIVPNKGN